MSAGASADAMRIRNAGGGAAIRLRNAGGAVGGRHKGRGAAGELSFTVYGKIYSGGRHRFRAAGSRGHAENPDTSSEGKSAGLIPQDNASINHSVLQEFSAILRRISSARSSAGVPNALLLKRALHKDQLVTTIQVKEFTTPVYKVQQLAISKQ
ncbi:hypothetical protein NDU88_005169 [Pleurodeles waltl]|uniref:Uncharacterized protein n=1 Tax=Pleurodeles waltl TaxID=8319 RepID=A0AAV7TBR8_PLEWA|nr:hypothetical protein NDU88_005169 [Pleurodeles waltl]